MNTEHYSGKQCICVILGASFASWIVLVGVIYGAVQIGEQYL